MKRRTVLKAFASTATAPFAALSLANLATSPVQAMVSPNLVRQHVEADTSDAKAFLEAFYGQRAFMPAWRDRSNWLPRATEAFGVLDAAERKGLRSQEYIDPLFTGPTLADASEIARADVALTRGVLKYIKDVRFGRYNPKKDYGPKQIERSDDTVEYLQAGLQSSDFSAWFQRVGPATRDYQLLLNALFEYEEKVTNGGWPRLQPGPTLKEGVTEARVPILRKILAIMGDYPLDKAAQESLSIAVKLNNQGIGEEIGLGDTLFGSRLSDAVKSFQARHGLLVDGILGGRSQNVMRVTALERLDQIKINLERLRWERAQDHKRFVRVNIPEYKLRAYNDGEQVLEMAVVVGRDERPTPILNDFITNIKFNPDWTVPKSIIEEDIVPEMQLNALYAQENHLETLYNGQVVDPFMVDWQTATPRNVSFRQLPGPKNPLGAFRFSMTNDQAIFLHDTPKKYLFGNTNRANSSGCVRVSDAPSFAHYLIDTPDWTPERTDEVIASQELKYLRLIKPVAVSLGYFTSWVDETGQVNFRNDIYGMDLELMAKMI